MVEFRTRNELITQEELETFEEQLDGLKLPEDYKAHMLKYNGGGTIEDYEWNTDENIQFSNFRPIKYGSMTMELGLIARENVLPENDIYIGRITGGSICMSLGENNGSIYVLYSDGERIDLASSFTEFINGLNLM